MRYFFDDCIDGVIELIQSQVTQIENKRNRVKVGEPEHVMKRANNDEPREFS